MMTLFLGIQNNVQHFIISCWKTNRSIWLPVAEIPTFLSHLLFSFSRVPSYKF